MIVSGERFLNQILEAIKYDACVSEEKFVLILVANGEVDALAAGVMVQVRGKGPCAGCQTLLRNKRHDSPSRTSVPRSPAAQGQLRSRPVRSGLSPAV